MGTHPIFESDFDCLTGLTQIVKEIQKENEGDIFQHAAASA